MIYKKHPRCPHNKPVRVRKHDRTYRSGKTITIEAYCRSRPRSFKQLLQWLLLLILLGII